MKSQCIFVFTYSSTNLTWRDVQYIIVLSSDRYDLNDTYSSWQTNGAYKQGTCLQSLSGLQCFKIQSNVTTWGESEIQCYRIKAP